jgi:FkbM family methyltransferase
MPMDNQLIMDFGMHRGHDTDFYLKKGFRVVAIEADPVTAEKARQRFAAAIGTGQLIIEQVGIGQKAGKAVFYRNLDEDNWSSFIREWGARDGTRFEEVEIECVEPQAIFQRHGMPYYLKIDIEGHDMLVVKAVRDFADRPRYMSVEENQATHFAEMWASGCRRFTLVNQRQLYRTKCPNPPLEGKYVDMQFTGEHSGLFGREISEPWQPFAEAMHDYLTTVRSPRGGYLAGPEWFDVHGMVE